jgi:hypothetical protein
MAFFTLSILDDSGLGKVHNLGSAARFMGFGMSSLVMQSFYRV